jgi:predicted transcriptional regulator
MSHRAFTHLQLRIMQVLWRKERATARDVAEALNEQEPISLSTVQTLLRRLERRGAIGHDTVETTFVFFPIDRNERVVKQTLQDVLDRLFAGSPRGMVSYLLKNRFVTAEELKELSDLTGNED